MSTIDLSTFHDSHTSSSLLEEVTLLNQQAWELRLTDRSRCLELSRQALEKADQINFRLGRGFALRGLGFCAYSSADHTAAFSILSEGLEIGLELENSQLERDCLNFLAAVSASIGDLDSAVKYLQRTHELNRLMNDTQGLLVSLINSGVLYNQLERDEESLVVYDEALERARALHDEIRETTILGNMGSSFANLSRFDEAERTKTRADNDEFPPR